MQIKLQELLDNISGDATSVVTIPDEPVLPDADAAVDAAGNATGDPAHQVAHDTADPAPARRVTTAIETAIEAVEPEDSDPEARGAQLAVIEGSAATDSAITTASDLEDKGVAAAEDDTGDDEAILLKPRNTNVAETERPTSSGVADEEYEEEYEAQHFSAALLSPLQKRRSAVMAAQTLAGTAREERLQTSGLIDIKSMAAAYLGGSGNARKSAEFAAIPVALRDDPTSPILLPATQQASSSKLPYILLGILGTVLVAATAVVVTLLVVNRGASPATSSPTSLAAASPTTATGSAALPSSSAANGISAAAVADDTAVLGAVTDTQSDVVESDEMTLTDDDVMVTDATEDDAAKDDADKDDATENDADRAKRDRHTKRDRESASSNDTKTSASASSASPAVAPTQPTTSAPATAVVESKTATPTPTAAKEPCDEVTCLVSGIGCCGKAKANAPAATSTTVDPNLPARPTRDEISSGLDVAKPRIQSCGDLHDVRGAVTFKVKIAPSGKVSSASTSAGSKEFQTCASAAVRGTKFPASQSGALVSYPYVLR